MLEKQREENLRPHCALNTGYRQEFWSVARETQGRVLAPQTQATDRSSGQLLEELRKEYLRPDAFFLLGEKNRTSQ